MRRCWRLERVRLASRLSQTRSRRPWTPSWRDVVRPRGQLLVTPGRDPPGQNGSEEGRVSGASGTAPGSSPGSGSAPGAMGSIGAVLGTMSGSETGSFGVVVMMWSYPTRPRSCSPTASLRSPIGAVVVTGVNTGGDPLAREATAPNGPTLAQLVTATSAGDCPDTVNDSAMNPLARSSSIVSRRNPTD